jgi:hypothetical protein
MARPQRAPTVLRSPDQLDPLSAPDSTTRRPRPVRFVGTYRNPSPQRIGPRRVNRLGSLARQGPSRQLRHELPDRGLVAFGPALQCRHLDSCVCMVATRREWCRSFRGLWVPRIPSGCLTQRVCTRGSGHPVGPVFAFDPFLEKSSVAEPGRSRAGMSG